MSSSSSRRVVVTGLGAVCALGKNVDEVWKNAVAGVSGISQVESFKLDETLPNLGGEVKNFQLSDELLAPQEAPRFDRFIHFALHAADEALKMAKLDNLKDSPLAYDTACILGVGMGGFPMIENTVTTMKEKGVRRVSPFFIPGMIPNMASGLISIRFGAKGISYTISSACASSGHALLTAIDLIRSGRQKIVISGGAEAALCSSGFAGFTNMKALSKGKNGVKESSRPFDKDRDGFVMGEGSSILILEDYEHAKSRGAEIYAEVLGAGSSSDAYHITSPHPEGEGAFLAMKRAIEDAGVELESITHVNAHATSTPMGDELEAKAIRKVFGAHTDNIWVTSTKSMTGHLLGAAAAIESFFCIKALVEGVLPPTINLKSQDEACPIRVVANKSVKHQAKVVINNVFGFGGTNASVIFKKYDA